MLVIRFTTQDGSICWGQPKTESGLSAFESAQVFTGNPYSGFQETDRIASVHRLLAPVEPSDIFAIGLNYRKHALETNMALPNNPIVFMKSTGSVIGPNDIIKIPNCAQQKPEVDFEGELAVLIGKSALNVTPENALHYIAGYTVANDVSARRWQKHGGGGQWVRGKSFDTFCPLGPALLVPDRDFDPQKLSIQTTLNDQIVQSSNTADMIFDVRKIISFLSQDTTLKPGTLILTGTPEGVGFARKPPLFLKADDTIKIQIEQIGTLTNSVSKA